MPTEEENCATELVELQPDVIFAKRPNCGGLTTGDHLSSDRICGRLRSGRQRLRHERVATGRQRHRFPNFETSMGSKWLELLKEIVPSVERVALMFNPMSLRTSLRDFTCIRRRLLPDSSE